MNESDFASLVGLYRKSDKDLTRASAIELMKVSLVSLMPGQQVSGSDICGATVVAWRDSGILLKDSEGKLYLITSDDETRLEIDQDGSAAYWLLVNECALDKVFSLDIVTEWQRLQS